jgi:outer membrane protein assembly factor BamB
MMRAARWLRAGGSVAAATVAVLAITTASASAGPLTSGGIAAARSPDHSSAASVSPAVAPAANDWAAYLEGPRHWSYNSADKSITPGNAARLVQKWHYATGQKYLASPVVANGAVYIGAPSGWFYKLAETTGKVLAKTYIGRQVGGVCGNWGVIDTATVGVNPTTGRETVYVGGPDGYLYAFNASNLSLQWKSVVALPDPPHHTYLDWSSPTVADGRVYIGVASYCGIPQIRGGVVGFNQATGALVGTFYSVPAGSKDGGASVWSSVAVAPGGYVYATTGNGPNSDPLLSYSESIVKLSPTTLTVDGSFQVPKSQEISDGDFGGSPTLFGPYVGACNKNGIYYVLNRTTMALVWSERIGVAPKTVPHADCAAAAIYNGKDLYLAGPEVTIKGKKYRGSIQERNPDTGKLIWETGLPNGVIGSPTMNGSGVIAVGTWDYTKTTNATYLVDAANGKILRTFTEGYDFPQSTFADGWLFTANYAGVQAWGAPKKK